MLLLVTNQRDITSDFVVAEMQRRNLPYFRLNTEQLPLALFSMDAARRDAWSIAFAKRTLKGDQVRAAYFRRPGAPIVASHVTEPGERMYAEAEWQSLLKSLYSRLDHCWLNSPTNILNAEDKPLQLLLAHEIGFNVPQASITNNLASALQIASVGSTVGKPLRQALLNGERERVIFTTRLDGLSDTDAQAIAVAPFIVQREVIKSYDVRVTVVDSKIFATAIHSQEHAETEVDWRQGSNPELRHEPIQLPEVVQQQCLELLKRLKLRYGAIDFVCDLEGKLWFLEVNPNGQWAWIENLTGYPIAAAIVDSLEEIARA
ncbi:hypothetical protein MHL40_16765 [Pseudomonas luteola]|uniref:hypothetical protein n=1 Tax=Pseudomonas luteola TaxID=47886 RepID=UPI001EF51B2E|nr:hypothetical protein [Pseudomonas luteola]